MSAHTILLNFSVKQIENNSAYFSIVKNCLDIHFSHLNHIFDVKSKQSHLYILKDKDSTIINVQLYNCGLITLNIEYYEDKNFVNTEIDIKSMHNYLCKLLESTRSNYLPAIKRGAEYHDIYTQTTDGRLLELDIDKLVFDQRSEFQRIQVRHSKQLGNCLILDGLENISESDLIYTETLMQRGIQNYGGKEICILGGGDGALLNELLKEKPKYVSMLEIDDLVMKVCNLHLKSICGDVLEKRNGSNYDIIVGNCMIQLDKYIEEGRKFDYVFGDLTDIPISDNTIDKEWNFVRTLMEKSFKILKPNGYFLQHGDGSNCVKKLQLYEQVLGSFVPKLKFTKTKAFVPSFMEEWCFYQIQFADA